MNYLERLSFGFSKKLPIVLQTEIAECGLACLTSIAGYHGYHSDLRTMRQKYSLSQKGLTLADIVRFANDLNLTCVWIWMICLIYAPPVFCIGI